MPFTPFHFGPGLLVKGFAGKRFSWTTFATAQVTIDCETLYYLSRHEYPIHRFFHTIVGATLAGVIAILILLITKPFLIPLIRKALADPEKSNRFIASELSVIGIFVGGLVGGLSHPFLDAIMHPDVQPFMPWSEENPYRGAIGLLELHAGCVLAGAAGLLILLVRLPIKRH